MNEYYEYLLDFKEKNDIIKTFYFDENKESGNRKYVQFYFDKNGFLYGSFNYKDFDKLEKLPDEILNNFDYKKSKVCEMVLFSYILGPLLKEIVKK